MNNSIFLSKIKGIAKKHIVHILIISVIIFFIFYKCEVINLGWEGRILPPEPDDSFSYIAGVRIIGDTGSYFYDLKYIWPWSDNDHLIYLTWNTFSVMTKLLGNFDYFDIYAANFYFGIIVLSFILLYTFKVLEKDKLFLIFGFLFIAFYNGAGEYHGLFWVVPSFYSLAATLLLFALVFDTKIIGTDNKKSSLLIIAVTLWLVWSHPLGIFSLAGVIFSLFLYILSNKALRLQIASKLVMKRLAIVSISGLIMFFCWDVLPYFFGIVPSRYYSMTGIIQNVTAESTALSIFQKLYLNLFSFNSYHLVFLIIGLAAILITRKTALLSIFLSFFSVAFVSSFFSTLGYRMLVYLWPITFILYSYGFYYLTKQLLIGFKKKNYAQQFRNKTEKWKRIKQFGSNKPIVFMTIILALVSVNYLFPFIQGNYNYTLSFANYEQDRLSDWRIDDSVVTYLNSTTCPSDLLIFSDSNAFVSVTALGLLDREVAYADWDWSVHYSFLRERVNGSYLISTGVPLKNAIQNLTDAFQSKLALYFRANFGMLNIYQISVGEERVDYIFANEGNQAQVIVDDFQTDFWSKSKNINFSDSNYPKVYGDNALMITLSQNQSTQNDYIWHTYDVPQDWTDKDLISFYWLGNCTNKRIEFLIFAPDDKNRLIFIFVDDFVGWNRIVIPFDDFDVKIGNPSLTNVTSIYFRFNLDSPYIGNYYLDQPALEATQSSDENYAPLMSSDSQTYMLIIACFVFVLFIPGVMWAKFVFHIRDLIAVIAISLGLSFSIVTLTTLVLNLLGVNISRMSTVLILLFVTIIPIAVYFVNKFLKGKFSEKSTDNSRELAQSKTVKLTQL